MPNQGKVATISAPATAGQPKIYVWRFWDGEYRVTTNQTTFKVLNRSTAEFSVQAMDEHGQIGGGIGSFAVTMWPAVGQPELGQGPQALPYLVELSYAGLGADVSWRTSTGTELSTSATYTHAVTELVEHLVLRVISALDPTLYQDFDFYLLSLSNQPVQCEYLYTFLEPDVGVSVPAVSSATLSPLTLSGLQTVSGVALAAGARVLAAGQTDPVENGVYVVSSTAWSRSSDELALGSQVPVVAGTYAGRRLVLVGSADIDGIVIGESELTYELLAESYDGEVVDGGQLIIECPAEDPEHRVVTAALAGLDFSGAPAELDQPYNVVQLRRDLTGQPAGLVEVSAELVDEDASPTMVSRQLLISLTSSTS